MVSNATKAVRIYTELSSAPYEMSSRRNWSESYVPEKPASTLLQISRGAGGRRGSSRLCIQGLLDRILDLGSALQPDNPVNDLAIPPDEEALRQCGDAAVFVADSFFAQ